MKKNSWKNFLKNIGVPTQKAENKNQRKREKETVWFCNYKRSICERFNHNNPFSRRQNKSQMSTQIHKHVNHFWKTLFFLSRKNTATWSSPFSQRSLHHRQGCRKGSGNSLFSMAYVYAGKPRHEAGRCCKAHLEVVTMLRRHRKQTRLESNHWT